MAPCLSQPSIGPNGLAAESRCKRGTNVRKDSDGAWHLGILRSIRNEMDWIRALVGRRVREQRPSPCCPQAGTSNSKRSRCQMEPFYATHQEDERLFVFPVGY